MILPVQQLRTSVAGRVPATNQVLEGQLALNMTDLKLYFKDGTGAIQRLGTALSDFAVVAVTGSYNDLADKPTAFNYTLPPATAGALGGVIVGAGLTVDIEGDLSANVLSINNRIGSVVLDSTDVGLPTDLLSGAGTTLATKYLPASVTGALAYQGAWNSATNTPTLASGVGTKGFYFVVSVAGTTDLDGNDVWSVGDYAIFNGTVWDRLANGSAVTSVNGQTGVVSITPTSLGLAAVATSGLYSDLTGVPAPYALPSATTSTLGGVKVTTVAKTAGNSTTGQLATVATTGSYSDLLNTPPDATVAKPGFSVSGNPNLFQEIDRLWQAPVQFPDQFSGSQAFGKFVSGTSAVVRIMKYTAPVLSTSVGTQVGTLTLNSTGASVFTSTGSVTSFATGDAIGFQFQTTNLSSLTVGLLGTWL